MVNKTNKLKTYESYYFNTIKNNTNIDNYPPTNLYLKVRWSILMSLKANIQV